MKLTKEQEEYLHNVIKVQSVVNVKMQSILHDLDFLDEKIPFKHRMKQIISMHKSNVKNFSTMIESEVYKITALLDDETKDEYIGLVKSLDDVTKELILNQRDRMDKDTQADS